jgi:hypothetical protein
MYTTEPTVVIRYLRPTLRIHTAQNAGLSAQNREANMPDRVGMLDNPRHYDAHRLSVYRNGAGYFIKPGNRRQKLHGATRWTMLNGTRMRGPYCLANAGRRHNSRSDSGRRHDSRSASDSESESIYGSESDSDSESSQDSDDGSDSSSDEDSDEESDDGSEDESGEESDRHGADPGARRSSVPVPPRAQQPPGADATGHNAAPTGGAAERPTCCICLEETPVMLMRPCNHLCACEACSRGLRGQCPICRHRLRLIERVYL